VSFFNRVSVSQIYVIIREYSHGIQGNANNVDLSQHFMQNEQKTCSLCSFVNKNVC